MSSIIHHIVAGFIDQLIKKVHETGIGSIGQLAQDVLAITKATAHDIVSATLKQADDALVAAQKQRRKDGLCIKERNVPRTLLTELGQLRYERTYFESKDGERYYLLDYLIGMEAYERLSKTLCASLVQAASGMSMQAAAKGLGVPVSRQTVDKRCSPSRKLSPKQCGRIERPRNCTCSQMKTMPISKTGEALLCRLLL